MKAKPKILVYLVIALIALCFGCATKSKTPLLNKGQLDKTSNIGVVLVSVGMHDKEPFISVKHLPIVSYDVYPMNEDGSITGERIMVFDGEPRPEVYFKLKGYLDGGKYGFIHLAELPAGKYFMVGRKRDSPGYGMYTGGSGVIYVPGTRGRYLDIHLTFEVQARHLNYIGEILTVSLDLNTKDGININDQFERDYKFALRKKPELNQLPSINRLANKVYPLTKK